MTTTNATGVRSTAGLRAVTRPLDEVDLLAHVRRDGFTWLHDETGIVASGSAFRVAVAEVGALLDQIEVDDAVGVPGTGPIAVGALPFDAGEPATLVVPTRILGRARDGSAWITQLAPAADTATDVDAADAERAGRPGDFHVEALFDRDHWRGMVETVLRHIDAGELLKVVLAREVVVTADRPFDETEIIRSLHAREHGCFVYAHAGQVGASPELLVRRAGTHVESRPLAGTVALENDLDALTRLSSSVKDAHEHQLVVDAIRQALEPLCTRLEVPQHPEVAVFTSVAHLATSIVGELAGDGPSALDLARRLHPTPAVAGVPLDAALAAIQALEPGGRGRYAGPVGWVDARGDGEWALALRGAHIEGNRARLFSGAGIVHGSEPDAEWAETEAKLETMLHALVRP